MSGIATAARPCAYATPCLRKNKIYLVLCMTIGIATAIYAMYNHSKSGASSYLPTAALHTILNSNHLTSKYAAKFGNVAARVTCDTKDNLFGSPMVRTSSIITLSVHVIQLVVIGVYSRSCYATKSIMGMSAAGLAVSMICMIVGLFSCKSYCMSCLGLQHLAIMYFGYNRLHLLKSSGCPSPSARRASSAPPTANPSAPSEKSTPSIRRRPASSK